MLAKICFLLFTKCEKMPCFLRTCIQSWQKILDDVIKCTRPMSPRTNKSRMFRPLDDAFLGRRVPWTTSPWPRCPNPWVVVTGQFDSTQYFFVMYARLRLYSPTKPLPARGQSMLQWVGRETSFAEKRHRFPLNMCVRWKGCSEIL